MIHVLRQVTYDVVCDDIDSHVCQYIGNFMLNQHVGMIRSSGQKNYRMMLFPGFFQQLQIILGQ